MKKLSLNNAKQWVKEHKHTLELVGGVTVAAAGAAGVIFFGGQVLDHLKEKYPLCDNEEDELREVEGIPDDFEEVVDEHVFTELAPEITDLILGKGGTIETTYSNENTDFERRVKITVE